MYNEATARISESRIIPIRSDFSQNNTYLNEKIDINNDIKVFCNIYEERDIAEQFKEMQDNIMRNATPILLKLLDETIYDSGYESMAEKYYYELSKEYGVIANTILINIYLQNMYDKPHLLKHMLFIIANIPKEDRQSLEIIPLAGVSNPDIEIQDLSVRCLEAWEDKRHLTTLRDLRSKTNVKWFLDYLDDVIKELEEE